MSFSGFLYMNVVLEVEREIIGFSFMIRSNEVIPGLFLILPEIQFSPIMILYFHFVRVFRGHSQLF